MRERPVEKMHVLEINLISAQGLKVPSGTLRRTKTYAVAWVDSDHKIRTRIDKVSAENPNWNDRFLFKVTSEFLARETSGISIEIYAVGVIRDHLVGTVRLILSNFIDLDSKMPSFTALQIRRPSGRFHGVLNVAAMLNHESEWSKELDEISAIGYRDLMGNGDSFQRRRRRSKENLSGSDSRDTSSYTESVEDISDGTDSFKSTSPAAAETKLKSPLAAEKRSSKAPPSPVADKRVLKDMNSARDLAAGGKALRTAVPMNSARFLCCLLAPSPTSSTGEEKR